MKKITVIFLLIVCFSTECKSASYDYVDIGDRYYINGFFKNEEVEVVRKLDNGQIKVRIISTGDAKSVSASELLTKSELRTEEVVNTAGGIAITLGFFYCLTHPDECK